LLQIVIGRLLRFRGSGRVECTPRQGRVGSGPHRLAGSRQGFTLIEIIIALLLLLVLYSIALPALGRSRISAAVHNSRHVVVSSLSLARAMAMRYGRPAVLHIDSENDWLWVEVDTTLAGSGAAVDTFGFFSFSDGLQTDLESNRATFCFNGRGVGTTGAACPQAGGVILLSLKEQADTVTVSPVGRVVE
jgi:prepilin-type N-terminal cleavage/methylation domain-containing protein